MATCLIDAIADTDTEIAYDVEVSRFRSSFFCFFLYYLPPIITSNDTSLYLLCSHVPPFHLKHRPQGIQLRTAPLAHIAANIT